MSRNTKSNPKTSAKSNAISSTAAVHNYRHTKRSTHPHPHTHTHTRTHTHTHAYRTFEKRLWATGSDSSMSVHTAKRTGLNTPGWKCGISSNTGAVSVSRIASA